MPTQKNHSKEHKIISKELWNQSGTKWFITLACIPFMYLIDEVSIPQSNTSDIFNDKYIHFHIREWLFNIVRENVVSNTEKIT